MASDRHDAGRRKLSPSLRLLIRLLGFTPGNGELTAVTANDWTGFEITAQRHGVSGLLAAELAHQSDVPAAVRILVNKQAHLNALRSLQGVSELIRIAGTLEEHRIAAIALKGPAFSRWLHGDAALRRSGDLDILVLQSDRDRAASVLGRMGYALPSGMTVKTASTIYGALGAWPLEHPSALPVDLHWRVTHTRLPSPLTPSQIIAEAGVVELGGTHVRIPSPAHAALLILLHAHKHLWCTLEGLVSIAMLMRRTDVDWRRVRALARDAHAWPACAAGLQLTCELLGAELPAALLDESLPSPAVALENDALTALELPAGIFQDRWVERRVHHAGFDRWADRLRYDMWRIVGPTPLEWEWCPLPEPLRPLYVPVRVARLAIAALRGKLHWRPIGSLG